MNNNYPFFRYIDGNSLIHSMNSKRKILWLLLSFLIILLIRDYVSLSIFSLLLLFVAYLSKIKPRAYISNLLLIWPLYLIFLIITYVVSFNVWLSIMICIKIMLIIFLLLIITFTTSLSEIAWGFECLFFFLNKYKIPVSKISLKIALTIKFIESLFVQYKNVRKSMAYRGVSYSTNKLITFKKMIIPAVSLSYKLSKRKKAAMKLRFYGMSKERTNYHEYKGSKLDVSLIVLDLILIYFTLYMGWL